MVKKNSIAELIWLNRIQQSPLPYAEMSHDELSEAVLDLNIPCAVPGCLGVDECILECFPFEVRNEKSICPRAVIRGCQETPRGA